MYARAKERYYHPALPQPLQTKTTHKKTKKNCVSWRRDIQKLPKKTVTL
jgi:hypothetical protein